MTRHPSSCSRRARIQPLYPNGGDLEALLPELTRMTRGQAAHGGLEVGQSKGITIQDYYLASALLRWTVGKLLELRRKNGIKHIATKGDTSEEEKKKSLNYYVETLKYS